MVGESRSVLPPAKRLKTEEGETLPAAEEMLTETPVAAAEEGETLPAADEMSTETSSAEEEEEMSTESSYANGKTWSPSEDFKPYYDPANDTPFDKMMDEYDDLDYVLSKPGYKVVHGYPLNDKEYLFLFCKLMSDKNYLKVLADKDIIYSWEMEDIRKTLVRYWSSSALPESVVIAKKIVDEHDMELGMEDILCCLKDLLADWRWRMRIRGIKEFEIFLLRFWEKNRKAPTYVEINKFRLEWRRATFAKFGTRVPTDVDIGEAKNVVWLLREGISTAQELEGQIEATYKEKLSEIHVCRPHYLALKLDKVEKSDLAKQIVEHFPAFGKLELPRMEMDPWRLDKDIDSLRPQLMEH